jgi:predicted kinase
MPERSFPGVRVAAVQRQIDPADEQPQIGGRHVGPYPMSLLRTDQDIADRPVEPRLGLRGLRLGVDGRGQHHRHAAPAELGVEQITQQNVDKRLRQLVRPPGDGQQIREMLPCQRLQQRLPRRKVPMNGADPDAGGPRHVRQLHGLTPVPERVPGGIKQPVAIAPRVRPFPRHTVIIFDEARRCYRAAVIVWINGAFGAGKTTTAALVRERLSGSRLFDPEYVGFMLRAVVDVPTGDFQDLRVWRRLTVQTMVALNEEYGGTWIAPMSLIDPGYRAEILGGLRASGVKVREFILSVPEDVLRARIDNDEIDTNARVWRQARVAQAVATFADVADAEVIDATATPDEVADYIADQATAG